MVSILQHGIAVFEYALLLPGIGWLAWLLFRPAGRAVLSRPPALPAWDVRLTDLFLLVLVVIGLGFAWLIVLQLTVGALLKHLADGDTIRYVLYGSVFHVGALLTWWLVRIYTRQVRRSAPPVRTAPAAHVVRAAVLTFLVAIPVLTAAALLWAPLLKVAGLPTARQEIVDMLTQARSPLALGLITGMALVVGPAAEELIFRAGLFRFLRSRTPPWAAFVASAGLFALAHANWVSFLPLFALGLILAAAYERTGRLAVPILAHALFNLNSLLLVLAHAGH